MRVCAMRIGYLWVQANGFAGLVQVDGEELNLDKGPRHILAGWPAIVAGRYRQLRRLEEGDYYLHELADINTWLGEGGYDPSYTEIEARWGDPYQGEQLTLSNLVNPGLFDVRNWRALQEARHLLAERITGHASGKLDTNPSTLENQLKMYEQEIVERGWPLRGKESCFLLWELLTEEHQAALQHTPCVQAMRHEHFREELSQSPTREISGMITALRTLSSRSVASDPTEPGQTMELRQESTKTLRAFLERLKLHTAWGLGMEWDQWPRNQRRSLAKRFLIGMTQDDFHHPEIPRDVGYLADHSWLELLDRVDQVDRSQPSRTPRPTDRARGDPSRPASQASPAPLSDRPQQTVFALQQQPTYLPSPLHDAHFAHGNHFIYPIQEQLSPQPRRRRRGEGTGNTADKG